MFVTPLFLSSSMLCRPSSSSTSFLHYLPQVNVHILGLLCCLWQQREQVQNFFVASVDNLLTTQFGCDVFVMQYGLTCWAWLLSFPLQTKIILLLVWSLKQILWNKIPNHVKLTCDSLLQEKEIMKNWEETWYFPYPQLVAVFFSFLKEFLFVAKLAISFMRICKKSGNHL